MVSINKNIQLFVNRACGNHGVVVPTICDDVKMLVDFNDGIDKSIFNHGFYDEGLTNYILKNIKKEYVCVDVGSNIGWISCLLGVKAKKVYSFECNPIVFNRLVCNVYLNNLSDKVVCYSNGVGDYTGEQNFVSYKHSGHGHLGSTVRYADSFTGVFKVDVLRLDDCLEDIKSLDFLKVDVEGFEFDVIKGAKNLIKKYCPVIVFEYNDCKCCLDLLGDFGYTFFLLGNSGDLIDVDGELKGCYNIVCKERHQVKNNE